MGWFTHVLLEVTGPADAIEQFRASFSEFWEGCMQDCPAAFIRYGLALELLLNATAAPIAPMASLQKLAAEALCRELVDASSCSDHRSSVWGLARQLGLSWQILRDGLRLADFDLVLHQLILTDPFFRSVSQELIDLLRAGLIEGHLIYEGSYWKHDLVPVVASSAATFPSLLFQIHSWKWDFGNRTESLKWQGGVQQQFPLKPHMDDFFFERYLSPVDQVLPSSQGWRSFSFDVTDVDRESSFLILASSLKEDELQKPCSSFSSRPSASSSFS